MWLREARPVNAHCQMISLRRRGADGEHHAAKIPGFSTAKKEDWNFGRTENQTSVGEPEKDEAKSEDGQFLCQLQNDNFRK